MKYLITILLCAMAHPGYTQVRTIIPAESMQVKNISNIAVSDAKDPDIEYNRKETIITFNLATLPDGIKITRALLRLVLDEDKEVEVVRLVGQVKNSSDGFVIRNKNNWDYAKQDEVILTTDNDQIFADMINNRRSAGQLKLRIFTQYQNVAYKIYNTTRRNPIDVSKIPRLVIEYGPDPKKIAWSGYLSDAQHTAAGVANFYDTNTAIAINCKKITTKDNIKNLSFVKDRLLFINTISSSPTLHAMDPVTGRIATINSDLRPPYYSAPVSGDSLYYYVTNDSIVCINLFNNGKKSVVKNKNTSAPVLAKDGSLYITNENYIEAYTPNPVFAPIWRYAFRNSAQQIAWVSTVSLSSDDSMAYAIYGVKGAANKLVAINTINRSDITVNLDMRFEADTLPVVVAGNSGHIYFINGRTSGNTLYIYDKYLTTQTIIAAPYKSFGRPVISNNNVYVVADDKILMIRGNKIVDSITLPAGKGSTSNIATDKDDNVYILSTPLQPSKQFTLTLVSFNDPLKPAMLLDLPDVGIFYDMLSAPDGSIYLNTNSQIFSVRPVNFKRAQSTFSGLSNTQNITYRSDTLSLREGETIMASKNNIFLGSKEIIIPKNVTFNSNTDNVFESGGKIKIGSGFKVQKGAKLVFKTGY